MRSTHPHLSLVIPVFNESENLRWQYNQIKAYMRKKDHSYEIIYIDDGSTDDSLEQIKAICRLDEHANARFISFSRNFGKEAALTAGLQAVAGEVAIGIDADGQFPLELIETFLEKWREGYDVVIGVHASNPTATFFHRFSSSMFYRLLRVVDSRQEIVPGTTDFRLIDRQVINAFNELTERNRVTRNLIDWLGFKRAYVPFVALERHGGKATYDFRKRVKLGLDGAIKHSTRPLQLIGGIGVLVSVLSIVAGCGLIVEKYVLSDPLHLAVTGTAISDLFLSFMIGIVLVCQGLLALYLENVYHETQNRPLYVIREQK